MSTYFAGQTIELRADIKDTSLDLTSASSIVFYYEKEDGTKGSFTGSAYSNQIAKYVMTTSETTAGKWIIQAYATWSGGVVYYGDKKKLVIKKNLT